MQPNYRFTLFKSITIALLGLWLASSLAFLATAQTLNQAASQGQEIFNQKCAACHTIGGGKLIGPDLQNVTQRRDLAWLERMIAAPDQLIAEQDPILAPLLAEYNNLAMPNLGLTDSEVQALLAYLENPDDAEAPPPVEAAPASGDPQMGRAYFSGSRPLANGGTHCIACHSTADLPTLGGGNLGPDLTQVATRLGDPGLASALQTLPFPTMQGIFATRPLTPDEQADLNAYFQSITAQAPAGTNLTTWYWLAGGAGALLLTGLLAFFWPRQRRSLSEILREQA